MRAHNLFMRLPLFGSYQSPNFVQDARSLACISDADVEHAKLPLALTFKFLRAQSCPWQGDLEGGDRPIRAVALAGDDEDAEQSVGFRVVQAHPLEGPMAQYLAQRGVHHAASFQSAAEK